MKIFYVIYNKEKGYYTGINIYKVETSECIDDAVLYLKEDKAEWCRKLINFEEIIPVYVIGEKIIKV